MNHVAVFVALSGVMVSVSFVGYGLYRLAKPAAKPAK